jgi:hypothetical protein
MHTKTGIVFSIITIAAAVLLFAAGPVVAIHQAFAYGHGGFGHGGYGGNGLLMAPCGDGAYSIINGQIVCTL